MNEEIIIFKNDKIGDLLHAYNAIQDIINKNLDVCFKQIEKIIISAKRDVSTLSQITK